MKFISVALIVGGLIGAVVASIKYRQYPEWEHWAEKLTYLLVSLAGSALMVVGIVVFIFSIQPE